MDKLFGVFISTPISGFSNKNEYYDYRKIVLSLISKLRASYSVCSEIEQIKGLETYDSPEKSVTEDFESIKNNDVFLFLHPSKMQTSSLIELGYAIALDKRIVIVGRKENLPYLAVGLESFSKKVAIIDMPILSDDGFEQICNAIHSLIEIL